MTDAQDFNVFLANPGPLKEFRVLLTCSICGEAFDSDYKLTKHTSKSHPPAEKAGWAGAEGEHNCSCGSHMHNHQQQ